MPTPRQYQNKQFEHALRTCDEVSSNHPDYFSQFLHLLVNSLSSEHSSFDFNIDGRNNRRNQLISSLGEILFPNRNTTIDDDDDDRDYEQIRNLACQSVIVLKHAIGKDYTADEFAEVLLTEYECSSEFVNALHELISKSRKILIREFSRETFGLAKRLEEVSWTTQVPLYYKKSFAVDDDDDDDDDGRIEDEEVEDTYDGDDGQKPNAVLELRMDKNRTMQIEFTKQELFELFKELEMIQMKIDDLK
jgi:hypothetical protein